MIKGFLLLSLLALSLFGEQNWLHSYEEAKAQAFKEKKLVLVMISREGCDACWYMENIVFEDEGVQALMLENFVPVYLDTQNDEIPEAFDYAGTPTFHFTDAQGNKIGYRIGGASNIKDFTLTLETILKEAKN